MTVNDIFYEVDKDRISELIGGDVNGEKAGKAAGGELSPLAGGFFKHPSSELLNESGALGHRNELLRRDGVELPGVPTKKRLRPDNLPLPSHNRLKGEAELPRLEPGAKGINYRDVVRGGGLDLIGVETVGVAILLRLRERLVALANQLSRLGCVPGIPGDADGKSDVELMAPNPKPLPHTRDELLRHDRRSGNIVHPLYNQGKLVPSHAKELVPFAQEFFEPRRGFGNNEVAHPVPVGFIHLFEVIQVDVEQAETELLPGGHGEGGVQVPVELLPIRQAREGIPRLLHGASEKTRGEKGPGAKEKERKEKNPDYGGGHGRGTLREEKPGDCQQQGNNAGKEESPRGSAHPLSNEKERNRGQLHAENEKEDWFRCRDRGAEQISFSHVVHCRLRSRKSQ